ncbi:tripartite tricarboxylate transporter permease [Pseudaminobacter arsenicus]|uniref:Tripartite tricarboxylate transporter permease n=1 Tax=Borborobacter arsenicus TaxID=1851146 RepID=A0A432V2Z9_9HYPH|nr:tripartite tricarboxylate transporter permease [Pseudaminobacter arsenicus]RUM96495.1 tripartite tricarboxylate transporter permease [Pseudaminobacter arsenicus]
MEALIHVIDGFGISLQPGNLSYTFIGVLLGTIIGVLPGIGPSAAMALLIPFCYDLNATSALIMMAGVYYGAQYGGAITSILINTPGESSSVMTAIDGYQMARKGRAGAALAVSAWGSFIGGTVGVIGLTLLAVPLTKAALGFGPAEYFMLMLVALTAVFSLTGKSPAKGMLATMLGLGIATVGTDLQSGQIRYAFGLPALQEGIDFIIVVIGMFAIGEVFSALEDKFTQKSDIIRLKGKLMLTRDEWRRSAKPIARGSVIGFLVGALPGAGATIASIMSYTVEKNSSKHPEEFGKGAIEGVAGPETANNGASSGAMVPLLTLGVPGSGSTAVLLGAFIMFGIQPGPMLFQTRPDLVWGLVNSMYVGNVMLLLLNLPLIFIFVRLLYIPTGILLPIVLVLSTIGVYAINNSIFELYLCLFFGVAGYIFRKVDIPLAPLVLAVVLGGIMEQSFRQAMTISSGSLSIFVGSKLTIGLAVIGVVILAFTLYSTVSRRRRIVGTEDN